MRKIILFLMLGCCFSAASAQIIFGNTITGSNPNQFNPYTEGQVTDPNLVVSGISRGTGINGSNANNRYNASGWSTGQFEELDYFGFVLQPSAGFEINLTSFEFTGQASGSGPTEFALRSSLDGYATDLATITATGTLIDLSGSSFQQISGSVGFRIYAWGASSATGTFSINDFSFTGSVVPSGGAGAPVIQINASLTGFTSVAGQPSPVQSYQVSGINLQDHVTVQAPQGYDVSLSESSGFNTSVQLLQTAGSLENATVYIRQLSLSPGISAGSILHSSSNAPLAQLPVSGLVLAAEPSITPTISFSNITTGSLDIQFQGGSGNGRLVVARQGMAVTALPADGTEYPASPVFGSGTEPAPGQFIVYSGSGHSVHLEGLLPNSVYHFAVFEYNDGGIPEAVNYNQNAATGIVSTLAGISGLQLTTMQIPYLVDFDHSYEHVNNNQFQAGGFTPLPQPGQLNSGAWSVQGWSDGDLDFLATATSGDPARGFTLSHPTTGGIYAFEPSNPGNRALGFQPGSNDWAPGSITLKVQNQSGTMLQNMSVYYKLYVYNNADRSSSFNLSWSADNINYMPVGSLDFISTATADAAPSWQMFEKSEELTGISIAPGQYVYLRWSSADAGGSGSRDEFALDDIMIMGNPVSGGPLPVRFITLKANRQPGNILIEFETASEENLSEHVIERSWDGVEFGSLTILKPQNTGGRSVYSLLDTDLRPGTRYYRVRSKETSGHNYYSHIVKMQLGKPGSMFFLVYPNPVYGSELILNIPEIPAGRYLVKIFDALGRPVMEQILNHEGGSTTQNLTVSHLQPGWYSVQISGARRFGSRFLKR